MFHVIYLSLVVGAAVRTSAYTRDGEPKSFRIYRLVVPVHGDLCAPPNRRADSPGEINEADRPGWMRGRAIKGPRDQKSSKISSYFSLFGCLRGSVERENPGRRSKIFQNLYVTCGLTMLIAHRAARAILYIAWSSDFSLWVFSNKYFR